jgi:RHS repeat-associated protein
MMILKNLLAFTAISLFASAAHAKTEMYYIHSDHLGTPQVLTDKDQQVVWRRTQTPFGETVEKSGTVIQPLRFPGQYEDPETGFYYNYFRDYDPATGRYLQSDPIGIMEDYSDVQLQIGIELGMPVEATSPRLNHVYGYVEQSPITFTDIYGLRNQGNGRHEWDSRSNAGPRDVGSCITFCVANLVGGSMLAAGGFQGVTALAGGGALINATAAVSSRGNDIYSYFSAASCIQECRDNAEQCDELD